MSQHLDDYQINGIRFANALCLCCMEAGNRAALRNAGILELFVNLLQKKSWCKIHERLISALACFVYCDISMEILMRSNITDVLFCHLENAVMTRNNYDRRDNCVSSAESETLFSAKTDKVSILSFDSEEPNFRGEEMAPSNYAETDWMQAEDNSEPHLMSEKDGELHLMTEINNSIVCSQPGKTEFIEDLLDHKEKPVSKRPKYSINSPTYQLSFDITCTKPAEVDNQGPLNIFDAQSFNWSNTDVSNSPRCYSPLGNASPYYSPEQSPIYAPLSASPTYTCTFTDLSPPLSPQYLFSQHSNSDKLNCSSSYGDQVGQDDRNNISFNLYGSDDHAGPKCNVNDIINSDLESAYVGDSENNITKSISKRGIETDETVTHSVTTESLLEAKHTTDYFLSSKDNSVTIQNILVLISRVTYIDDSCCSIVSLRLCIYLIQLFSSYPRASRILQRIMRNTKCFEKILISKIPLLFILDIETLNSQCLAPVIESCGKKDSPKSLCKLLNSGMVMKLLPKDAHSETSEQFCLLASVSNVAESYFGSGTLMRLWHVKSNKVELAVTILPLCK